MVAKMTKSRARSIRKIRSAGFLSGEPFAACQVDLHGTQVLSLERVGWVRRCDDFQVAGLPFLADTQGEYWTVTSEGKAAGRALADG